MFALAPGQQASPVAIQRRFTLIKQKNLDLEEYAVANKALAGSGAEQVMISSQAHQFQHFHHFDYRTQPCRSVPMANIFCLIDYKKGLHW